MKKILIIEDDENLCRELADLLTNSSYEAAVLKDFSDALGEIRRAEPDLILLDINIPVCNGEMLLKDLRKESDVPVIMVTSRSGEADEVLSMSYGADDYITKPYNPTILLLRIGAILRRTESSQEVVSYRGLKVNLAKACLLCGEEEIGLTKNEMLIFRMLLANRERIVSRDELMTELWNNSEFINDNALTVNISRLRAKLAEAGCEEAIVTRKGQGYLLV